MNCGVIGSRNSQPAGSPSSARSSSRPRARRSPSLIAKLPSRLRVVDQPLPADGGARLLEVDPHHEQRSSASSRRQRARRPRGVLERRLDVVDRAGAHDDQEPVVLVAQDAVDGLAALGDRRRRRLRDLVLLHQDGRRDQRSEPLDPEVVGWTQNHGSVSAFFHSYLRLQDSLGT